MEGSSFGRGVVTINRVTTTVRDVETEASVGLHPWERHPERPTRVLVSVEMWADLDGRADQAGVFLDYDPVRSAIHSWPGRPHVELLETLAEELVELCFENPKVQGCRVEVLKPDIFNDAAGVGVEIRRDRAAQTRVSGL